MTARPAIPADIEEAINWMVTATSRSASSYQTARDLLHQRFAALRREGR